jgi:hypothetical protein
MSRNQAAVDQVPSTSKLDGPPPPSSSFGIIKRENTFRYPSTQGSQNLAIHELIAPHITSFNALFDGPDGSPGLLGLAIADLPSKVVFDSEKQAGDPRDSRNRLECQFSYPSRSRNPHLPISQTDLWLNLLQSKLLK